jgi:peptidoglycan/LPS O-acetylase OafA/YrhL
MASCDNQTTSSALPSIDLTEIRNVKDEQSRSIAKDGEFRLGYRPSLDGIRALSILVVMVCHSGLTLIPGGVLGMSVFFVLSGFLITALLMQEWNRTGSISLKQFYYRRALRLLPALFALLFVCCLYGLIKSKDEAIAIYMSVAATLFYVTNWISAFSHADLGPLAHTWSLSVEEQFYMLFPLVLSVLLWLKLKRLWTVIFLLFVITASVVHTVMLWENGHSIRRVYYGFDARVDELLIGCLIGILASWNVLPKTDRAILISKIAAVVSVVSIIYLGLTIPEDHPFMNTGATTIVAMGLAVIIINLISTPVRVISDFLELQFLVWIGRISYGIYIWHYPIFRQIGAINLHPALTFVIQVGMTFAVASLSYYFIEQPFLRLKNKSAESKAAQQR